MNFRAGLLTGLAVALVLPGGAALADHIQTFVSFDPGAAEFPEGVAVAKTGELYVSLTPRDEIVMLSPDGTRSLHAVFERGTAPVGLAVDAAGTVYAAASGLDLQTGQTDPATRGVFRIDRDGSARRLPGTEAMQFPNDVVLDKRGNVYATDSLVGAVWRIPRHGPAELWLQDPLLEGTGASGIGFPVGANGIAHRHNRLVVANSEQSRLVEIPIRQDGSPGQPTTLAEAPELFGADGIAFAVNGDVYVASILQSAVVRVGTAGAIETLVTAEHGLSNPSTLAFGTGRSERRTLFVANFSLFAEEPTPGIVTLPVDQPGQPVP